jgi:hypothetical protein
MFESPILYIFIKFPNKILIWFVVYVINAACDGFQSLPLMYLSSEAQQVRCFHTRDQASSCSANALYLCSVVCSVWISAGILTLLTKFIYGYSQSSEANSGIVPEIGHDRFLSDSFQSIVYESSSHSTLRKLMYWQHHKVNHTHMKASVVSREKQDAIDTGRRIVI